MFNFIRNFICIFCLIFTVGCASPQNTATITANSVRKIANSEHEFINQYCTPKYWDAKTQDEISKIDYTCLPLKYSYEAVKKSWEYLVILIKTFENGGVITDTELQLASQKLARDLDQLRQLIEETAK